MKLIFSLDFMLLQVIFNNQDLVCLTIISFVLVALVSLWMKYAKSVNFYVEEVSLILSLENFEILNNIFNKLFDDSFWLEYEILKYFIVILRKEILRIVGH